MFHFKKRLILFSILGVVIILIIGFIVYLFTPVSFVKFSNPEIYTMSEDDIVEIETLKILMSTDSTRYCEGDFNGDGLIDRAVADAFRTTIIFNIGTNDEREISQNQIGSSGFTCISCADMNHDGQIDLLLGDFGDQGIDILYNNGKGNFKFGIPWKRSERIILNPNGTIFMIKDINQDDRPDIVYQSKSNEYYHLINLGNKD